MKSQTGKILLSALAGFVFYQALMYFWAYFPNVNPFFQWLLSCCAGSPWFRSVLAVQDLVINVVLCIPLGVFLIKLKSSNLWLCIAVAILPSFVLGNFHLLAPEASEWHVGDLTLGWAMQLLSLPVAVGGLLVIRNGQRTG